MNYKGEELHTMGEVFDKALYLAKVSKDNAIDFFKAYIEYILENNDEAYTFNEAEKVAKANLGYFTGYYNQEVCDIIYKTYQCSHPIFGNKPFSVTAEEAFKKGYYGMLKKD